MTNLKSRSIFFINALISAALFAYAGSTNAGLESRLGGEIVYDNDRNLSVLADGNLAASETFGVVGINADGSMDWNTAFRWVQAMNAANYLGFNDWRLASAINPELRPTVRTCRTNVTYCINGDLVHLFLNELSGAGVQGGLSAITDPDVSLFGNFPQNSSIVYWTGTDSSRGRFRRHRVFVINDSRMYVHRVSDAYPGYVLPVRDGDVVEGDNPPPRGDSGTGGNDSSGGNGGNGDEGATPPAIAADATEYEGKGRITAINPSNLEVDYKTTVWYSDSTKIKFGGLGDFSLGLNVKVGGMQNPDGQVIASKIVVK